MGNTSRRKRAVCTTYRDVSAQLSPWNRPDGWVCGGVAGWAGEGSLQ
jgi:hypothetical protein